ncbi:MAG: hypothetical protein KA807_12605 [Prolixibacteraceae bacterium]|nr:hypothetical protein [Prolixibacteraceae bacterium]
MNQNVKILVITVPSWNSKVGANSWATLLEKYPPENIASLYIRDEIPDSKVCSMYFSISENKIIKSIFHRKVKTGSLITLHNISDGDNQDLLTHNQRYVNMKKKRRYSMLLARELIWKVGRWHTPELDSFLDSFKPDVILHSMDGYIHLNRIIEYAIKRTGAAAVGYIWDDNFTYKQSSDIGYKIYRFFQRRSLKRLARLTNEFFAISQYTKKEADDFFGIECHLLTKPLLHEPMIQAFSGETPIKMLYTGSLIIGRDRSLLRLSKALKKINCGKGLVEVNVYTQTVLPAELLKEVENEYCHVHKPIPQNEALTKQNEADILLFLEDIDGKDAKVARLSFSTKITDYLSTGKCILAIGNIDTAPMQYFSENDAAIICKNEDDILTALENICNKPDIIDMYAQKAILSAKKNHDPEFIRSVFDEVILTAVRNNMIHIEDEK